MICSTVFFVSCEGESRIVAVSIASARTKEFWPNSWWKADEGKHEWLFLDDDAERSSTGARYPCSGCGEPLQRDADTCVDEGPLLMPTGRSPTQPPVGIAPAAQDRYLGIGP
jgi:hypothetical protein